MERGSNGLVASRHSGRKRRKRGVSEAASTGRGDGDVSLPAAPSSPSSPPLAAIKEATPLSPAALLQLSLELLEEKSDLSPSVKAKAKANLLAALQPPLPIC